MRTQCFDVLALAATCQQIVVWSAMVTGEVSFGQKGVCLFESYPYQAHDLAIVRQSDNLAVTRLAVKLINAGSAQCVVKRGNILFTATPLDWANI